VSVEPSSRRGRVAAALVAGLLIVGTMSVAPVLAEDGASLTVVKATDPASDPQDFDFDLTGAGLPADLDLDTDGLDATLPFQDTFSLSALQLGAHTVTESVVAGWSLTNLSCTGDSDVIYDGATATLDIDPGETVVCTFTNTRDEPVHVGTIGQWRNWRNHYSATELTSLTAYVQALNPSVYGQQGNLLDASRVDAIYAFGKKSSPAQILLAQLTALKLNLAATTLGLNLGGEICTGGTVNVAPITGATAWFGATPTVGSIVAWIEARWTGTLTTKSRDWSFSMTKAQLSIAQAVVESINTGEGVLTTGCP
jgi:hypothetical protein